MYLYLLSFNLYLSFFSIARLLRIVGHAPARLRLLRGGCGWLLGAAGRLRCGGGRGVGGQRQVQPVSARPAGHHKPRAVLLYVRALGAGARRVAGASARGRGGEQPEPFCLSLPAWEASAGVAVARGKHHLPKHRSCSKLKLPSLSILRTQFCLCGAAGLARRVARAGRGDPPALLL